VVLNPKNGKKRGVLEETRSGRRQKNMTSQRKRQQRNQPHRALRKGGGNKSNNGIHRSKVVLDSHKRPKL